MVSLDKRTASIAVAIPVFIAGTAGTTFGGGQDELNEFVQHAFLSIEQSEYEIRWQSHVGAYQSPNREQNLRFTYLEDGFTVQRRLPVDEHDDWLITLRLHSYQRDNSLQKPTGFDLNIDRNQAQAVASDVVIEYRNTEQGMRQTFVIGNSLSGPGPLQLNLTADLQGVGMAVDQGEDFAVFNRNIDGQEAMHYTDLNVWDANGQLLAADMVQIDADSLAIIVDDQDAVYPVTVDPLSVVWTDFGGQSGAQYGYSVAGIGNLEGVLVGAPFYDNGQAGEGRVFFYAYDEANGSVSDNPDWTAESNQAGADFGYSVADAGDVDDNDVNDIIIGARSWDEGTDTDAGRAFVWYAADTGGYGNAGTPSNADWQAGPGQDAANYGSSVAGAGNVFNDDAEDVIVGAPGYDTDGIVERGAAFVYDGKLDTGLETTEAWSVIGPADYDFLGESVSSAGNVDGDSYDDIIIGAPDYQAAGDAYVYHGNSSGLTLKTTLAGNQTDAKFGFSVASAGSIDGDAYPDVIVGAPIYNYSRTSEAGRVYVFEGDGTEISTSASWTATSAQAGAQFGYSVASHDLDADGNTDVVVGAPYYDSTDTDAGSVFAWFGSSSGLGNNGTPSNADEQIVGDVDPNSYTGFSVDAFNFPPYFRVIMEGSPGGGELNNEGAASINKWTN